MYIYYMYMVCTRVEPAIFEKREDSRRGSRRGGGCSGPSPPLNYQNIHLREQDFLRYQGVTLYAYLKIFGSPVTLLNRLYGVFLFMNTCTAVYEDNRK